METATSVPVRTRGRSSVTFVGLSTGVMSFTLMQSMTNPVLATIAQRLDTDQTTASWVLTAYLLSAAVFTPLIGRIGDAVGKRRMVVVSLLALAAGSVVAALAPTVGVMIGARIVQGVGGGVVPLTYGIIRDELEPDRVSGALGFVSSLLALGVGVGMVVAGPIVAHLGYSWLFWLPMIASLAAAAATWTGVPQSRVLRAASVPVLPALLLSGGLVSLLLPVSRAPRWGLGLTHRPRPPGAGRGPARVVVGR